MDLITGGLLIAGASTAAALAWKHRQNAILAERMGPQPGAYVGEGGKASFIVDRGGFVRGLDMNRTTQDGRRVPHWGVDIAGPEGTPVHAAVAGQVVRVGPVNGYGNVVAIQHSEGGKSTLYAHLQAVNVRLGESVAGGKVIGFMGRTTAGPDGVVPAWGRNMGVHLHMEVHPRPTPVLGSSIQRDDPVLWLRQQGIALFGVPR